MGATTRKTSRAAATSSLNSRRGAGKSMFRICNTSPRPAARIGDLVAIFQSGAYGLTASPVMFLGHPVPPEIFVADGRVGYRPICVSR